MSHINLIFLSVCLSLIFALSIGQTYSDDDSDSDVPIETKKAAIDSLSNSSRQKTENSGLTKDIGRDPPLNPNSNDRSPDQPALPDINSLFSDFDEEGEVKENTQTGLIQATQSNKDHTATSHVGAPDLPNIDKIFDENEDDADSPSASILTSPRPNQGKIITEGVIVNKPKQNQFGLSTQLPDLNSILKDNDFFTKEGESNDAENDKTKGDDYTETVGMENLDDDDKDIYNDPDDVVDEKEHEHVNEDIDDTKTFIPSRPNDHDDIDDENNQEKEVAAEADSDEDEDYEFSKWSTHKQEADEDDTKEEESKQDEDVSEIHGHMMEDVIDEEMIKKNSQPTAPSGMVLLYTWLIVAILIIVVGISTYQARCKGFKLPFWKKSGPCNGEDKKRLLDHEFV